VKILLGVHQFFPKSRTGTEVLTFELARNLSRRGHSVQILAGEAEDAVTEETRPWLTQDEYEGLAVYRLHYGMQQRRDPIALHFEAPARVAQFRELALRLKPDVVHFNHVLGLSARVLSETRDLGIPLFFTATDFWSVCPKVTLFRQFDKRVCSGPATGMACIRCCSSVPAWLAALAHLSSKTLLAPLSGSLRSVRSLRQRPELMIQHINSAGRVFASTRFLADVLIRHGADPARIRVVPYGVELGRLPDKVRLPQQFRPEEPLRLGFIGSLAELKGAHVILEALEKLGPRARSVQFECYGSADASGAYAASLRERANGIGGSIKFAGTFPHREIGGVLRSLHLVAVPSVWYESAPLVLCSSLAAGIPVLVSALGGLTEPITEGVNGFSFPAGDAAGLATIIARLLDQPELLRRLHQQAECRPRTISDYADDIEAEYRNALKA
jgi:glycosyltransferase involved in cell wall biosynthesis